MDKMIEESIREAVEQEISQDYFKPDLMAQASDKANGDKELTKKFYQLLRIEELKAPYQKKDKKTYKENFNALEGIGFLIVAVVGIYTLYLLIKYFARSF